MDRRRVLLLAPFGVAVVAGAGFFSVLGRMRSGKFDPHDVPSQLIDKPLPAFSLPGFGSTDVASFGRPVLLNFFASWCVPCVIEHPSLMSLSREGVSVWGIAYKDTEAASQAFIAKHGNPYGRVARDAPGQVAIDFGVYGVPESYLVDRTGVVRWRYAGPITPEIVDEQLHPMLRRLA